MRGGICLDILQKNQKVLGSLIVDAGGKKSESTSYYITFSRGLEAIESKFKMPTTWLEWLFNNRLMYDHMRACTVVHTTTAWM